MDTFERYSQRDLPLCRMWVGEKAMSDGKFWPRFFPKVFGKMEDQVSRKIRCLFVVGHVNCKY